ncbi:bacterio-opsin activator domain-containing protein [Natronolimnobius sp. AArcel1]|uniref:bacterio-opsin activator domain-containing protein n=1 Tax=Natronolimnobius sp. AArcel1 TaxID=1679093 RepID=UPI0031B6BAD7
MNKTQERARDDAVVEVEFTVSDPGYPLVALSAETACSVELIQLLPRSNGSYTVFQRVAGCPPKHVLSVLERYDKLEACVVSETDTDAVLEVRIDEDGEFFTISLTDAGAIPTELSSHDGTARIVAEIPPIYSASAVIEQFQEMYPRVEIVARRQKEYAVSLFRRQKLYETALSSLTPRQHEALFLAYMNGFYDWPRKATGEELAAEMDVSPPTFHEHLRSAEQTIFSVIFGS